MAGGRADAERLAIPELGSDLRAYVARMRQGQALVEQRLGAAEAVARDAINKARGELSVEMGKLEQCRRREEADCSWAAAAVHRAKLQLEATYAVARDLSALRAQHQPAARRFGAALETLTEQVQRELTRAGNTLDAYLGPSAGGAGGAGGGGGAGAASAAGAPSLSRPAGFPADVVLVPLSLIDDSDSGVNGAGDFTKGYSPADLEWAHEAFLSVVMPGGRRGATLDDFRARDQREGRVGARSYADTYSGFFGDSKITLDSRGSTFTVANGYHRIWVARNMGLDAVPAKVGGHGAP